MELEIRYFISDPLNQSVLLPVVYASSCLRATEPLFPVDSKPSLC